MLATNGSARIFVCHQPTDLRKGFQGLSAVVTDSLGEDVANNAYFAFINRGRDRTKSLYFDGDGLAIWQKRLAKGRFPKQKEQDPLMSRRSFFMLMEGMDVTKSLPKKKGSSGVPATAILEESSLKQKEENLQPSCSHSSNPAKHQEPIPKSTLPMS